MPTKLLLKIFAFILVIGSIIYINQTYIDFDPEQIQRVILSFGLWAPLIFIMIFSLRPFVLFPSSILAIAGGLSFGPLLGPVITYIGSLSGALLSFLVIRYFGKNIRGKKWQGKGNYLQEKIEENGFLYVVALRIIPVVNFDFVSYLAAISRISFQKYIAATILGIIPGTLAFNFLGASFVDLNARMMMITGALFLIAFSIPIGIRRIMKKKNIDILPYKKI